MNTKLQSPSSVSHLLDKDKKAKRFPYLKIKKNQLEISTNIEEEERIRLVIEGQSSALSIKDFCIKNRISIENFNLWSTQYLIENDVLDNNVVEARKERSRKKSAVLAGTNGLKSVAQICREESISHSVFLKWCEDYSLESKRNSILFKLNSAVYRRNISLLSELVNESTIPYFENYIDLNTENTHVNVGGHDELKAESKVFGNLICLQKLNDVRFVNKHLELVNSKLESGGIFVGCMETLSNRKGKMRVNKLPVINKIYTSFEFIMSRVLPKVSFTKGLYFRITKGKGRLMSKAEGLGRLVSCGFKIMDFKTFDNKLYFVVKKVNEPIFDENPSYGPVYKMTRLGKNGKLIGVYKFRTMHPYSEYLQDYIVNSHGYAETGKPANDFRIPGWGKFMRRFWLDEIPQLINVLKGELKLVGVRPVSKRYFQDIPKEMQKLRNTQKPGCIPPYVALNREGNVMSVLQSEKDYLIEKIKNPYFTDLKYFFKAIFNIIVRHKRSA